MRRLILVICIMFALAVPVQAAELTAPTVPESGVKYMPDEAESFGEGLWIIIKQGIRGLAPDLAAACRICFGIICGGLLLSVFRGLSGMAAQSVNIITTLLISTLLLKTTNTMIGLAADTITEISEYGKQILPVMAASLAAQGGSATSAALFAGTSVFAGILNSLLSSVMIPVVYVYLALCVACAATENEMLGKIKSMILQFCGWGLKTLLSLFTGFLAITGVVSGTTDAAAAKVTRAAISAMVPVVGRILSEATDSVLVGAGVVRNAAGVYGLLAAAAVCIGPFLQLGVQYLLLKLAAAFCAMFTDKQISTLTGDFSSGFGLLLGMTGAGTLLLIISIICFMKGMG